MHRRESGAGGLKGSYRHLFLLRLLLHLLGLGHLWCWSSRIERMLRDYVRLAVGPNLLQRENNKEILDHDGVRV